MEMPAENEMRYSRYYHYRWCIVPGCQNTSIKSPSKLFVCVPKGPEREKWFRIIRRNVDRMSLTSVLFCCEDHFNLEEDMENWMRFKMMGGQVRLKKGVVPRFSLNRKNVTEIEILDDSESGDSIELRQKSENSLSSNRVNRPRTRPSSNVIILGSRKSSNAMEKQILEPRELVEVEEEVEMEISIEEEDPLSLDNMSSTVKDERLFTISQNQDSDPFQDLADQLDPRVQKAKERKTLTVSPLTFKGISNWISGVNGDKDVEKQNSTNENVQRAAFVGNRVSNQINVGLPSKMGANNAKVLQTVNGVRYIPRILKAHAPQVQQVPQANKTPTSDLRNPSSSSPKTPLILSNVRVPQVANVQMSSKNTVADFEQWERNVNVQDKGTQMDNTEEVDEQRSVEDLTNLMIMRKPYLYTGLYGNMFNAFMTMLMKRSNESCRDVLMILMKIRLDDSFSKLEDMFGIFEGEASEIFEKVVPNLANVLKGFIFQPDIDDRVKAQVTSCVKKIHSFIDYFHVKTHVPGDWRHKNCKSVKFLIACTDNGVISFVSPGYQKEETDVSVMNSCQFPQIVPAGAIVVANSKFQGIQRLIQNRHSRYIESDWLEDKISDISAENMARSREKLVLILERLKEFRYIGPEACIPSDALGRLNQVMIIASAIVNIHKRNKLDSNGLLH